MSDQNSASYFFFSNLPALSKKRKDTLESFRPTSSSVDREKARLFVVCPFRGGNVEFYLKTFEQNIKAKETIEPRHVL